MQDAKELRGRRGSVYVCRGVVSACRGPNANVFCVYLVPLDILVVVLYCLDLLLSCTFS